MSDNTKTCLTCKRSLAVDEFSPKGAGQRHAHCRSCRAASARSLTYTPEAPHSFFIDQYRSQKHGDMAARQRLDKHAQEMRSVTTGGGAAGLVPPAYLADEWVGVARSGRPFASIVTTIPLAEQGVQFSIPAMSTGTAVGVQATENSSVTSQDIVSSTITANVVEIVGQMDLSQQVFQRMSPGIDTVLYADFMSAYSEKLDSQLLNGTGANGQHLGIRNVSGVITQTYTQSTPDAQTCLVNIGQAASQIGTQRKKLATHIVLHPRRYHWLQAAFGTASLFEHESGTFAGMQFVLDPNVTTVQGASTSQDEIYVVYANDFLLAESEMFFKLQDVGSGTLTVRGQIHTNSLWYGNRYPKSIAVVSGTGLSAPSGY